MKWGKTLLIILIATTLTALGIDAADTIRGSEGTLLSQVIRGTDTTCPSGMAEVESMETITCVDLYEASAGEKCPIREPEQVIASITNLESAACVPESAAGRTPWSFITREQAMQACARAGKRLPTSAEWYALALGSVATDASCNVRGNRLARTGTYDTCVTPQGAFDVIGNLWEWVSDDVIEGQYHGRVLPGSGYVTQVDADGLAVAVGLMEDELFGADYFWSNASGTYGVIRGGYYDSGTDAGIYSVHADTPPTTASPGIGFRCVR